MPRSCRSDAKWLPTVARRLHASRPLDLSKPNQESRRADSNRLPLLQLLVVGQALQGFAAACKPRVSKPLFLLWLALGCTVLRSRWCQSGVKAPVDYALRIVLQAG